MTLNGPNGAIKHWLMVNICAVILSMSVIAIFLLFVVVSKRRLMLLFTEFVLWCYSLILKKEIVQ